jgi:hypothetical protein
MIKMEKHIVIIFVTIDKIIHSDGEDPLELSRAPDINAAYIETSLLPSGWH